MDTTATRDPDKQRISRRNSARRVRATNPEPIRARERSASARRVRDGKVAARTALNNAVRSGKVVRPALCSRCHAEGKVTGHHHDYSKPLDVIWLCYQCHADEERRIPDEARSAP